jgi:hypothetical protein
MLKKITKLKTTTKISLVNFVKKARKLKKRVSRGRLQKTFNKIGLRKAGNTDFIWLIPEKFLTDEEFWKTYKEIKKPRGKKVNLIKNPKKCKVAVAEETKKDLDKLKNKLGLKSSDLLIQTLITLYLTVNSDTFKE